MILINNGFIDFIKSISLFFILVHSPSSIAAGLKCNGGEHLCDKLYNEVTYATAHNGHATQRNPLLGLLPGSNINDQNRSILRQFEDGIRAIKIPLHSYQHEIYACHGMSTNLKKTLENHLCENLGPFAHYCSQTLETSNPCSIDPATQQLGEILKIIENFLRVHPYEVLTVFLEDDAGDFEHLKKIFVDAKLESYAHIQRSDEPWPTLKEMIMTHKRLVIFNNQVADQAGNPIQNYPIFNPTLTFTWQSRYSFKNLEELQSDDPLKVTHHEPAFTKRNDPPHNKLWILQHFVTPTFGGSEVDAAAANQEPLLSHRIQKYRKMAGSNPNFIWVDFYELPQPLPGIFTVINHLNDFKTIK